MIRKKKEEKNFCDRLKEQLAANCPLKIAFNEPYAGIDDGLTSALRQIYSSKNYLGIEIELNQKLIAKPSHFNQALKIIANNIMTHAKTNFA